MYKTFFIEFTKLYLSKHLNKTIFARINKIF